MNALEMNVDQLAEYLDELFDADGEPKAAAAMLRKQHKSIVKLRNAIEGLLNDKSDEYIPSRLWDNARQALKDTEESERGDAGFGSTGGVSV